jgi:beta-glucanase (GH16 family)
MARTSGWRRVAIAGAALALACGLEKPQKPPPSTPSTTPTTLPPPGYSLAWSDEFDGTSLDTSKWTPQIGPRRGYVMTPGAAQVKDGLLSITTYTDSGTHYSAFLTTQDAFLTQFGYFEARILFDDSPGEWCAFWLESPTNGTPLGDPATAGVEIDVVEHRVTDQGGWTALRDMVAMNLNWDGYGSNMKNAQKVTALPGDAAVQGVWHTYGVLWTSTSYTFYVDGNALWTQTQAVSHRTEAIQLTCEVQDASWAGNVPAVGYGSLQSSSTRMLVDWVRVWQPTQVATK